MQSFYCLLLEEEGIFYLREQSDTACLILALMVIAGTGEAIHAQFYRMVPR